MMKWVFLLLCFLLLACNTVKKNYEEVIINIDNVNQQYLSTLDNAEKALLQYYLFAYGNSCNSNSKNNLKCLLLSKLNIKDECETSQINFLRSWFGNNMLMNLKLNKCPQLPSEGAVKNTIDKIVLSRKVDTLTIVIKVRGVNNLQEKYWDIEQTDSFLIKKNTLVKIVD